MAVVHNHAFSFLPPVTLEDEDEDDEEVAAGADFTHLHFGRKLFGTNFYPRNGHNFSSKQLRGQKINPKIIILEFNGTHPIFLTTTLHVPWRDSISRPKTPVSSVAD
jgi:hypothetical protein